MFIGAGLETSGELKYIPLLCGRTVIGSIYGGVRTQSDLPKIVEKCVNKVNSYKSVFILYVWKKKNESCNH